MSTIGFAISTIPMSAPTIISQRDPSRVGVWVADQFAWLGDTEWEVTPGYQDFSLVTRAQAAHPYLNIDIQFTDCLDFVRDLLLRKLVVKNTADHAREIRIYFHYEWELWGADIGDTVFYHPPTQALIAYKGQRFLSDERHGWGQSRTQRLGDRRLLCRGGAGLVARRGRRLAVAERSLSWRRRLRGHAFSRRGTGGRIARRLPLGCGKYESWRRPCRQPSCPLPLAGQLHRPHAGVLVVLGAQAPYAAAGHSAGYLGPLPSSLLTLRTQVDSSGAIIAGNNPDIARETGDTYSYLFPRVGAIAAVALDRAGYTDLTRPILHILPPTSFAGWVPLLKIHFFRRGRQPQPSLDRP